MHNPDGPLILAIESSCDDTAAAVLKGEVPLSNVVSSQLSHSQFGGVVPEMASREHMKNIRMVTEQALHQSGVDAGQLDAVAFTKGPGLPGSLMVGASFAKGMALALSKPLIAVNHMEAHVLSLLMAENKPVFPFLCLVVSGGHTMLILAKNWNNMELLGQTRDDAIGEAFDKCAKLLGLGYPGGRLIDEHARQGNPKAFSFPVAKMPAYQFSYSGVKTAFLYLLQEHSETWIRDNLNDLCASVQEALLKPVLQAGRQALREFGTGRLGIAGGVAANSRIRTLLSELCLQEGADFFFPPFEFCTDNAGMIGRAAQFKFARGMFSDFSDGICSRLDTGQGLRS
jgi:N6-L-threonylcarbamoyladenine synthase